MKERDAYPPPAESGREQKDAKTHEELLTNAVRGLLDALDRCGGDEPDCPHCGPARAFALDILNGSDAGESSEQKSDRVSLRGRAGTNPTFRTTRNGVSIARLPLATRDETGDTVWQTVVAFGPRAERLRGANLRGQVVEVVGYVHEREGRTRGGQTKLIREIYAAAIRPVL